MSKPEFTPKIYIEQTEGDLQELSDAVLVGINKDDKNQISLSYLTTLDISDILKLLGASTVLISRICSSLEKSGVMSAEKIKEGVALASMLESLKMKLAEQLDNGDFFEETKMRLNPQNQEVVKDREFEEFMRKLMNGGMR